MKRRSRIRNVTPHVLLTSALVVSCRDYTCADTADCPIVDAGVSTGVVNVDSRATRAQDTALSSQESANSTSRSPSEGTDTSELAVSLQASDASAASGTDESEGATSSAPEGQGSSGTPGVSHEPDASAWTCDADAGCECEEGETRECWEHPDGSPITDDSADALGDCRLGKQECTNGKWGSCAGAVAPEVEDSCDRPLADDNCNGLPNEGCACIPEETRSCGVDVSPCRAGTQTCGADGQWGAACVGEIPPAEADSCAEEGDDADCNGEPNEGCECVGDEVESCNDCGQRSCNPATGRWGACVPVASSRCNSAGTGIEVCSAQARWQNQACANADAVHCSVACEQAGGAPSCVASAKDVDGDGYRAAACAAAPGDDCDDSTQSVSPGSTELCDGVDNDCDHKVDLSDGLTLAGAIKDMPGYRDVGVASQGNGTFGLLGVGIVSTSPLTEGLFNGNIDLRGEGTFSSTVFAPVATESYIDPRLAWSTAQRRWGATHSRSGRGGTFLYAGNFTNCCGEDMAAPGGVQTARRGDITARSQGDLLMVGASASSLYLSTAQGSTGSTPLTASLALAGSLDTFSPRVAANGNNAGVIWQTQSPRALNWAYVSSTLQLGAVEPLSATAYYSDLSAVEAGYGIAWVEGLGFRMALKDMAGTTSCTSSVIPFGTIAANQQVALGDSANGIVVVATSPDSNAIRLFRFTESCELLDETDVHTGASAPTDPRVVRSGSSVLLYWAEGSDSHYRFVSDLLCH